MDFKEICRLAMCVLGLIWLGMVVHSQYRFKKEGVLVKAKIIDMKHETGHYFPVYKFYFEGQDIVIDGMEGKEEPQTLGKTVEVYYIPGESKGVVTPEYIKIKPWQIVAVVLCVGLIGYDIYKYFM